MRNARTLVVSLGLLAVLAVAAAWLSSGGTPGSPDKTYAAGPFETVDLRCSDVFLDVPPLAAKDAAPGAEDVLVAKALVSLETTGATTANIRTQGYGGIQSASVNPPDDDTCGDDVTAGNPEANRFNDDTKFNSPNEAFGNVSTTATLVDKSGDTVVDHANFNTCFFSPSVGWVRTDTNTPLLKSAAASGSVVHGQSSVYILTPTDANPCDDVTLPAAIRLVTNDYKRDPATDDPTQVTADIVADPDGTAGTPPPQPQPADGVAALFDDWDGDGCTDWDELHRKDGGDPFNPDDCDKNYNGIFNILVTVLPSSKGPNGSLNPGIYFYCVANFVDTKLPAPPAVRNIDVYLICYQDNGAATPMVERINTGEDGLAGAPPPPPYGFGELTHLNGTYTPTTNTLTLAGCFASVEGDLGPNVYVTATLGGGNPKNKGFVGINANETKANCNAGTPSGTPAPEATPLFIAEQPDTFDHDGDGCTDAEELDSDPDARLGRDPFNPYDCDFQYDGSWDILITLQQQDVVKATSAAIPGKYIHCTSDWQVTGADPNQPRPVAMREFCYVDDPATLVNPAAAGTGDGLGGVAPPPPFAAAYEIHAKKNIVIPAKPSSKSFSALTCIRWGNRHIDIWWVAIFLKRQQTGGTFVASDPRGTADVYLDQPGACASPPPGPPAPPCTPVPNQVFCGVPVQLSEQGPAGVDRDGDNCSDREELSNSGSTGGLRDPYNVGDFMSVHTGPVANLQKDQVVSVADISAVVARFGTNDAGMTTKINRNTDPKSRPTGTTYHPSYDRGGPIPNGAVAGSVPRQTPATTGSGAGSITVADISATVSQFGHSCAGPP